MEYCYDLIGLSRLFILNGKIYKGHNISENWHRNHENRHKFVIFMPVFVVFIPILGKIMTEFCSAKISNQ